MTTGIRNIFVVDDNPGDLELILTAFQEAGIDGLLTTFAGGIDAQARLKSLAASGQPLPTHMFIDLNMPVCSGFDLLGFLKSDPAWAGISAHILTTSNSPTDRKRCAQLGADGYLVKPTSFGDLIDLLTSAVKPPP